MAIVEVMKYNGQPDIFAWKYPSEELGTWTQLIVNESQEAILYKGGKALDVFGSGRHTLDTANIPFLNKLINLPFGGRSPFTAEVWYVNKIYSLDIKWGTISPIQIQDPKYKVFVPVRGYGQFGIQIEDSKKFITKLVGTLSVLDKASLVKYFRGIYLTKAKDVISSYVIHKQVSVLEINAYLDEISHHLQERLGPFFEEYGIRILNFFVNDINVPEDDSAVIKLKAALAKRAEMDIIGYNYQQERSFDTLEGAANNQGSMSADLMGTGIGLAMGLGVGGNIGNQFANLTQTMDTSLSKKLCPKCQVSVGGSRFCGTCGHDLHKEEVQQKNAMGIQCAQCNEPLEGTAKFCPNCGKKCHFCSACQQDMPVDAMSCLQCHTELPAPCGNCGHLIQGKQVKFCPECGFSVCRKCPQCGIEVDKKQKFCFECGKQL